MRRVGIVAKSNLREATRHLAEIEAWLAARGLEAVFETATAALMAPVPARQVPDKPALAAQVDLVFAPVGHRTPPSGPDPPRAAPGPRSPLRPLFSHPPAP